MAHEDWQNVFQYQPLSSHNSIRLLTLLPGKGNAKLTFTLCAVEILSGALSKASYEALSYTWGDPSQKCEVWCAGSPFMVTESLYEALSYLRHPDRSRTLWIDAVCINQSDKEERAAQVAIMRSIYTQADRVIIWLGAGDDLTFTAIGALVRLWELVTKRTPPSEPILSRHQVLESQRLTSLEVVALARFFQRPWFKRVWVVQEAVCASRATVVCGACFIEWDRLAAVCQSEELRDAARVSAAMIRSSPGILAVRRIQNLRQEESPVALLSLLASVRVLDATDPRDKLFAVQHLGRVGDDCTVVNYNSPVAYVYVQYAINSLKSSELDILSAVNPSGIRMRSKMRSLPSWAPDWSLKPDFTNYPGEHLPLIITASHFRAGGSSRAVFNLSESLDILTVRGVTIDAIDFLGLLGAATTSWDDSFANLDFEFDAFYNANSECGRPVTLSPISINNNDFKRQDNLFEKPVLDNNVHQYETSKCEDDQIQTFLELLVCDTDFEGSQISPRRLKPDPAFMKAMLSSPDQTPHLPVFIQQPFHPSPLLQSIRDMSWGRRFCSTSKGYIGWVPQDAQVGDVVCCFLGTKVLMLLRPKENSGYSLIGECYLHGLMHGEALEKPGLELQDFDIH
jgi:hypothetical protein